MRRTDVIFPSGGGSCAAWLHVPDSAPAQGPMIVMAHGLGGVRQMRLDAFERNVAQQLDFLARYVPIGSGDVD